MYNKKIIIITGATKGLGLDIFNTLRPNYEIATISRNTRPIESLSCLKLTGDITNPADVKEFFSKIYNKWGKVDILINNAGLLGEFKDLVYYNEKEIDDIINLNIKGTFLMTQEAVALMKNNGGGLIINIGSTRSITGAPNKSLYTMTKFAMRGLTQCINAEYNIHNIYSTIICPGSFRTVDTKEIAKIIEHIIELPKESHIPEIIIGGRI